MYFKDDVKVIFFLSVYEVPQLVGFFCSFRSMESSDSDTALWLSAPMSLGARMYSTMNITSELRGAEVRLVLYTYLFSQRSYNRDVKFIVSMAAITAS